jgi:mxaK protein
MVLSTHRWTRMALGLAALVLAATAVDGALLWRDSQRNSRIAAGTPPEDSEVAELRFAQAHALAATGDAEAALNSYRALHADPTVGQAARFNSANLLLRQALELRAGEQPGQALPLIELAKEQYRELLRRDPQHWDARYNLERAQRLLPDPPEADQEPATAPQQRERSATTMRAQTLGLP